MHYAYDSAHLTNAFPLHQRVLPRCPRRFHLVSALLDPLRSCMHAPQPPLADFKASPNAFFNATASVMALHMLKPCSA